MTVLVVGSMAYDSIATFHGEVTDALGGSATYFSIASSLITQPQLVAVIGSDFREEDIALLAHRGVDLAGLQRAEGETFRWGGRYHEDMNHRDTLFTHLNVFESFSPEIPEAYKRTDHVFLANIDPELQLDVLDQVHEPGFVACDTMNFWIEGPKRAALDKLITRINGLVINDQEAELLTGESNVRAAAEKIGSRGPSLVVIKQGAQGALVWTENDVFHVPAYALDNVVDPTGAGDTFAGGFFGTVASRDSLDGETLRMAAVAGTALASYCCEGFGLSRLTEITKEGLESRSQTLRSQIQDL